MSLQMIDKSGSLKTENVQSLQVVADFHTKPSFIWHLSEDIKISVFSANRAA